MSRIGLHKLAILFFIILSITGSGTGFERQNKVIFVKAFFCIQWLFWVNYQKRGLGLILHAHFLHNLSIKILFI